MKEKRIDWIDIARAIGITFVIIGHVAVTKSFDIWIHAFHMPLFFVISGLCFNEKKNNKFFPFLKKRFMMLIFPYIIFSIALYYLWNLILSIFTTDALGTCSNLLNCMYTPASTSSCFGAVNWFLPALFFCEIFFYIIVKWAKASTKKYILVTCALLLMGFLYPRITDVRLPFSIDTLFLAVFFYEIGFLMRKINFSKISNILKKNKVIQLFIFFLFLVFGQMTIVNGMTNMRSLLYGDFPLYIINAVGISILILLVSIILSIYSKRLKIINLIKISGGHTMIILLLNSLLAEIYRLFVKLNDITITNKYLFMANSLMVSLIILIICVFISIFVNRYIPFIIGKKKSVKD